MSKHFNFNNEEYTLPIEIREDGHVTINVNGSVMEFASVQELAENYAIARNVSPENLKNWVLVEDGNIYSFVLRAATAGVDFFANEGLSWCSTDTETRRYDDEDEDDEEYEYGYYEEQPYDTLSANALKVAEHVAEVGHFSDIEYTINNNEQVYQFILGITEELENTDGGFDFAFEVMQLVNELNHGNIPQNDVASANRDLQLAVLARRPFLQISKINITTNDGPKHILRDVTAPFRPTELVVNVRGTYLLIER